MTGFFAHVDEHISDYGRRGWSRLPVSNGNVLCSGSARYPSVPWSVHTSQRAKTIRFGIQQGVQRLLHPAANHFLPGAPESSLYQSESPASTPPRPAPLLHLPRTACLPGWWAPSPLLSALPQTRCLTDQTHSSLTVREIVCVIPWVRCGGRLQPVNLCLKTVRPTSRNRRISGGNLSCQESSVAGGIHERGWLDETKVASRLSRRRAPAERNFRDEVV